VQLFCALLIILSKTGLLEIKMKAREVENSRSECPTTPAPEIEVKISRRNYLLPVVEGRG
jgi:hypothetical protein